MAGELPIVISLSLIIGVAIGYILVKYTNILNKITQQGRVKNTAVKDLDFIAQKLNEGKFVDDGRALSYEVVEENGIKTIKENRGEIKDGTKKNTSKVQKPRNKDSKKKKPRGKTKSSSK